MRRLDATRAQLVDASVRYALRVLDPFNWIEPERGKSVLRGLLLQFEVEPELAKNDQDCRMFLGHLREFFAG